MLAGCRLGELFRDWGSCAVQLDSSYLPLTPLCAIDVTVNQYEKDRDAVCSILCSSYFVFSAQMDWRQDLMKSRLTLVRVQEASSTKGFPKWNYPLCIFYFLLISYETMQFYFPIAVSHADSSIVPCVVSLILRSRQGTCTTVNSGRAICKVGF